jgi:large subunit ribosomal protein L22
MKATLSNHHQSPRKVQLVANFVRGKSVAEAERALTFLPKYAAGPVKKLLASAVANARQSGIAAEELMVKTVRVDKGLVGKRGRPFARGRSGTIRKRMSHITIELASKAVAKKVKKAKVTAKSAKTN